MCRSKRKRNVWDVALFHFRRFLWDPSSFFLSVSFSFALGLLFFLILAFPGSNVGTIPYDRDALMQAYVRLGNLSPQSAEYGLCLYLLENPIRTTSYSLFGAAGFFQETDLLSETWFRYLLFLPVLLFPLDLLCSFEIGFGEDGGKNLMEARIGPKTARGGALLYFILSRLIVTAILYSICLLMPWKGNVLFYGGGTWSLIPSVALLLLVFADSFIVRCLLAVLALLWPRLFHSGIDFAVSGGATSCLIFGGVFLLWSSRPDWAKYLPLTFGCVASYGDPALACARFGIEAGLIASLIILLLFFSRHDGLISTRRKRF